MEITIVLLLAITVIVFFFAYKRNEDVYNERKRILDIIHSLNVKDIHSRCYSEWRWEKYHEITYEEMCNKFWIPVKKFYENHPCIQVTK
jgi:hypothetical protein